VHTRGRTHGFIIAFFDDHDEPMVIYTPLFAEDALATDLGLLLGRESSRECGYAARMWQHTCIDSLTTVPSRSCPDSAVLVARV
jgi:hypothetical protein